MNPRHTLAFFIAASLLIGCGSKDDEPEPASGTPAVAGETPSAQPSKPDKSGDQTGTTIQKTTDAANRTTDAANKTGDAANKAAGMGSMGSMQFPAQKDMMFNDDVETNVEPPKGLSGLIFTDTKNKRVHLSDYIGKNHVVLVFTEGFSKMLCPFCKAHTSRLVANYEKFKALNAEVLVVYPGERDNNLEEFLKAARTVDKEQLDDVPFPVVLDQRLEAVDHFDIRSQLAHPSTCLLYTSDAADE